MTAGMVASGDGDKQCDLYRWCSDDQRVSGWWQRPPFAPACLIRWDWWVK